MTYEEIIKDRQDLEKAIYTLISDYEQKTKLHVSSVNIRITEFSGLSSIGNSRKIVTNVSVDVLV